MNAILNIEYKSNSLLGKSIKQLMLLLAKGIGSTSPQQAQREKQNEKEDTIALLLLFTLI